MDRFRRSLPRSSRRCSSSNRPHLAERRRSRPRPRRPPCCRLGPLQRRPVARRVERNRKAWRPRTSRQSRRRPARRRYPYRPPPRRSRRRRARRPSRSASCTPGKTERARTRTASRYWSTYADLRTITSCCTTASADGTAGREALCKYVLRPPLVQERLHRLEPPRRARRACRATIRPSSRTRSSATATAEAVGSWLARRCGRMPPV